MLGAVLLGLVAGVIARTLMPGDVFRNMSGPASWLASRGAGPWEPAPSSACG